MMPVHLNAILAFAILVASSTAKETKPTKRQLPVYLRPGADPRELDPQLQGLLGSHRGLVDPNTGRLVRVDPRAEGLDPAQLQAYQLGFVPREPQPHQRPSPQYNQLLRLIDGNQDAVQATPQQFLQQNLASRKPQQFSGQAAPAPVRLTQEQIEQNQIQDVIASKGIREQEARDVQRLQQLELGQYLQQQGISQEYLRQLQVQPQLVQRGRLRVDPQSEAEAEAQVEAQNRAQARAQAEAQARANADARARANAEAQATAQAEAQARAQHEAHARAQAERQARAQAEAQARAQAEAQARAQAETQARAQAEAQARAQAEAQARAQADAQARAQADAQARAQAEAHERAQVDAQKRAQVEEDERANEEQSRAVAATLVARAQLQPSQKAAAQQIQSQYDPDVPERFSYSSVQFGSSKLSRPPRIFNLQPSQRQLIYHASHPNAPQPSPQPEYVEIPQQQRVYKQQVQYSPELEAYREAPINPGIPEVIVKDRQTPNQYLIETTNFASRPTQPVFRPQPALRISPKATAAQKVAEQREQAIYTHQALEAATTPDAPSRSSIFVTTARTPSLRPRNQEPEIHQEGGRPLTQGELKALLNAGFSVRPNTQPAFEEPSGVTYYQRGSRLGKRQDKPVPKPVPLTEDERRALAREGIRGLYRIEPAGTEEGEHVKYVLALGKPIPSH